MTEKSGKREYAFIAFFFLLWLIAQATKSETALETLKVAHVPLMAIVGWGTGLHVLKQIKT